MNSKNCEDCQLHWDITNDGHICNGTLVREQYSISICMGKWEFMETETKMKVWDANCNTVYAKVPSFSCNWSFESFCDAPDHMIARAVNLFEDEIFEDIFENKYDASLEAFDMNDPESIKERQEKIEEGYRIDAELENIAKYYDEEEASFMSTERVS